MKKAKLIPLLLVICTIMMCTSCNSGSEQNETQKVDLGSITKSDSAESENEVSIDELTTVTGTFTFAKLGQVTFEVYPQYAPQSALNFLYLAQNGCFNGVITDRIQNGFTVEMGKYLQDYVEAEMPGGMYSIKGEFPDNGVENPLSVAKGMLLWCRDYDDPDSAQNEFMICLDTAACQSLQGKYAPFGKITGDGMEIIGKIGTRKVNEHNRPKNPVLLLTVELDSEVIFPAPDMIRK